MTQYFKHFLPVPLHTFMTFNSGSTWSGDEWKGHRSFVKAQKSVWEYDSSHKDLPPNAACPKQMDPCVFSSPKIHARAFI